ncbi:MAG: hypothetical protein AABX07_05590 [Nanoarchaeota archaeon]
MTIETRFRAIRSGERDGRPAVIHEIDQFGWFSEGMEDVSELPDRLKASVVDFLFPNHDACLTVRGKSYGNCTAYFTARNGKGLWKVFEYNIKIEKKNLFVPERVESADLRIFTTEISPFLHRGEYSPEALRIYSFCILGYNCLEVTANRGESADKDTMALAYLSHEIPGGRKDFLVFNKKSGKWDFEIVR